MEEPCGTGAPEARREVRLALVLKGGISLAVWMGGVTNEIDLLRRRQEVADAPPAAPASDDPVATPADSTADFWRRLLTCLDVDVVVDVVAGTSAGGLNGALLATAVARGAALEGLRRTWVEIGDFDTKLVIKEPKSALRSILRGDVFQAEVNRTISKIGEERLDPSPPRTVTLFLTGTALRGENDVVETHGERYTETENRVTFKFSAGPAADENDFVDDPGSRAASLRLARAARATAAFPGAFEPAFVNATTVVSGVADDEGDTLEGPNMAAITGLDRSRWVLDGGILDNEPFHPLMTELAARPVAGDVDRVVGYVVPSLGEVIPDLPDDDARNPPGILTTAPSAFSLPREADVRNDLELLTAMADNADADQAMRRRLLESALEGKLQQPAAALFELYRRRRRDAVVWETRRLALRGPRHTEIDLRAVPGTDEAGDLYLMEAAWIPPLLEWDGSDWRWGESVVDRFARMLLGLVREELKKPAADRRGTPANLAESARRLSAVITALASLREQAMRRLAEALEPDEVFTLAPRDVLARANAVLRGVYDGTPRLQDLALKAARAGLLAFGNDWRPKLAAPEANLDDEEAVRRLVTRYLHIEVVERTAMPAQVYEPQPPFRFHRFSLNPPTPFVATEQSIREKLMGLRFHHFGAFFRQSWRAYDWTWGRLDGAAHLIQILATDDVLLRLLRTNGGKACLAGVLGDVGRSERLRELVEEHRRTQAAADPSVDDDGPTTFDQIRATLIEEAHHLILEQELPVVERLEPDLRVAARPDEPPSENLTRRWSAICRGLMATSVEQLARTEEGREVLGWSVASALRALALDEKVGSNRVRDGLRVAARLVRWVTQRGRPGKRARRIVLGIAILLTATILALPWLVSGAPRWFAWAVLLPLLGPLWAATALLVPGRLTRAFRFGVARGAPLVAKARGRWRR